MGGHGRSKYTKSPYKDTTMCSALRVDLFHPPLSYRKGLVTLAVAHFNLDKRTVGMSVKLRWEKGDGGGIRNGVVIEERTASFVHLVEFLATCIMPTNCNCGKKVLKQKVATKTYFFTRIRRNCLGRYLRMLCTFNSIL